MLGQILVAQGALSADQLENALREQSRRAAERRAIRLGDLLMEMRLVTREQLERALAEREKAPSR